MKNSLYHRCAVMGLFAGLLAGCGNPYALKTSNLNYDAPQQPGSIRFTDPKLYKREALINERREEIAYLDELLGFSKTQIFSPEIVRELEVIASLSAALGVRVDPAAGKNYRRDEEVSDIQHEIALLGAQAELARFKELAAQGSATDTTPGSTPSTSVGDLSSNVGAASAEQLTRAIAALQTSLTSRLDGAKAASASTAAVNPLDLFQDRAAYRSLLHSAKNAAALDELHDRNGAALVRLYFSATVLPPAKKYRDTLAVLRMEVAPPDFTKSYSDVERVYSEWLGYVNSSLNKAERSSTDKVTFTENSAFVALFGTGDLFDTVTYEFSPSGDISCQGLALTVDAPYLLARGSQEGCKRLLFAVPRPLDLFAGGDHEATLLEIADALISDPKAIIRDIASARSAIRTASPDVFLDERCRLKENLQVARATFGGSSRAIDQALHVLFLTEALSGVELHARRILSDAGEPQPPLSNTLQRLAPINSHARGLLDDLIALGKRKTRADGESCTVVSSDFVRTHVPTRFMDTLIMNPARVAVYEVGPREQVQQISTTARAAEAIALAAAIAGQIPSQGLGADGNIAYTRSAVGKADARERVPLVASFAEPAELTVDKPSLPSFGWLLGPQMTLDPRRQRLVLEQQIKPYDLSVDLSVPGWWPYLYLDVETAWAPDWRDGSGRTISEKGAKPRRIKVELGPNSADFGALTARLSGTSSIRFPSISSLSPQTVSACSTSTELQIFGDNIWRASTVVVGGRKFEGAAVSVLPDMSGVLVSLNALKLPAVEGDRALVTVLTPYGPATKHLKVAPPTEGQTCDPPPKPAEAPRTTPTIATISSPELSVCVSAPVFTIRGTNLKDLEGVSLAAVEGKAAEAPPKNGTEVEAKFPDIKRGMLQGHETVPLTLRTKQGSVTTSVKIVSPVSCG